MTMEGLMHDGHRQEAKAPRAAKACRFLEPSPEDDRVAAAIVHAAYMVHKALGPGLLQSVYEACFCRELGKAGLRYTRQTPVPLIYGVLFD